MNYIVLDLEWNQSFTAKRRVRRPVVLHGEIIEIGAVKLDDSFNEIDNFKILVSPKFYTRIHKKVHKLTNITEEDLQYGFPFPFAFKHFRKWCGEDYAFLTWGDDDIRILKENMQLHNFKTEVMPKVYNVQLIFDSQITKENRQVSLTDAVDMLKEPAFSAHDALNDAKNTVKVCRHLDMAKGLAGYDELKINLMKNSFYIKDNTESPRIYKTRIEALMDDAVNEFHSDEYDCNVKCTEYVRQGTEKYICIGKCDNGAELFIRFKFTRFAEDEFMVSRLVYEMNDEYREYYERKSEKCEIIDFTELEKIS